MTCIVGLVEGQTVWMGGDRAGTDEYWHQTTQASPKVFLRDVSRLDMGSKRTMQMLIGYTSSFRMGQLLRHHLEPPEWNIFTHDSEAHTVKVLVPAIRTVLTEGGWSKKENNREEGGLFLVGFANHLLRIQGDFAVLRAADGYDAIGCGGAFALGALHGSIGGRSPSDRVRAALEAAAHHSAGVRGPFDVLAVG